MIRYLWALFFSLVLFAALHTTVSAYNGPVHAIINEMAAKEALQLNLFLKDHLKIPLGIDQGLKTNHGENLISHWLAYGGEAEDFNAAQWAVDINGTRAYNHFHDPLKNWDEAGLDAAINVIYFARYGQWPVSQIIWGLEPGRQDFPRNQTGDWSWAKAREYYYRYLTGNDFAGNPVAVTQTERDTCFADCFRALGQVMHLLEDASVPLHTRNDVHILPLFGFGRWTYETYTARNLNSLDYTPDRQTDRPNSLLLVESQADSAHTDLPPVRALFDSNHYNPVDSVPPQDAVIGLAEYTNANFLTNDTFWTYPHPALEDTNYDAAIWSSPELIDAEDGEQDQRIYFSKTTGEPIEHLMAAGYWYYRLFMWNKPELKYAFILDETCYADYAAKLVPRAAGYAAALLDYFFRGRLGIRTADLICDPLNGSVSGIDLDVKNSTFFGWDSTIEPFEGGALSLALQYTAPDGSEQVFDVVEDIYVITGPNDPINSDYVPIHVDFDSGRSIPGGARDIIFTLVFRGRMGGEDDAVAARRLTAGYKVAYAYQPGGPPNKSNILTILFDGSSPSNQTTTAGPNPWYFSPAWSPDSTRLAYEKESCSDPDFSPGVLCPEGHYSRSIVVVDDEADIIAELRSIDDTSFPEPAEAFSPSFSPGGDQIVAGVDIWSHMIWGLAIYDLNAGIGRYINDVDFWMTRDLSGSGPVWSPAGDSIAYYLNSEYDERLGQMVFEGDLCLIKPDGSNNIKLTDDDYINIHPSFSPDGQSILFNSNRDGDDDLDIWILDLVEDIAGQLSAGNFRKLVECTPDCFYPVFSPDGNRIIYEQSGDIKAVDLNLSGVSTITHSGYQTLAPAVSPRVVVPVDLSFAAVPAAVSPGQTTKLVWHATNAHSLYIDSGIGSVGADGIIEIAPGQTTTYTLKAHGQGGEMTATATISVK